MICACGADRPTKASASLLQKDGSQDDNDQESKAPKRRRVDMGTAPVEAHEKCKKELQAMEKNVTTVVGKATGAMTQYNELESHLRDTALMAYHNTLVRRLNQMRAGSAGPYQPPAPPTPATPGPGSLARNGKSMIPHAIKRARRM